MQCPLCSQHNCSLLGQTNREYYKCSNCSLVFVPKQFHLSPQEEKAIYDQHENNPDDPGYRKFLSRLTTPLLNHIAVPAKGLDFGSGPGPTLSVMLEENGFEMSLYDPFFSPDETPLENRYDFVTSTEVVEHVSEPSLIFDQLFSLLKPGGVMGIMTKLVPTYERFSNWHYTKDPTHITFYSRETFSWIAARYHYEAIFEREDVILLLPRPRSSFPRRRESMV